MITRLPKEFVDTGAYAVRSTANLMIEAHLGTCVGVTLCDREAGVGGLIHFLLAEPVTGGVDASPQRYASTGMPMFIEAMVKAGAAVDRLVACLAGGALVGPPSALDLNLDIGGRTTEVVERILRERGIPVAKSETGGFFTCRIGLNLTDFETEIEPILIDSLADEPDPEPFDGSSIPLDELHPIPQIVLRIMRMIEDSDYNFNEIARVLRQDQTLSARIIYFSNSSFFRRSQKIDSIDRALAILGEKNLLRIVLSASMERLFPTTERGYSLCKGGLFRHAVGAAEVAARIAELTGRVPQDVAYTAGLLHDIGKVALDQHLGGALPMFYRRTQGNGETLLSVESAHFGVDHADLGGRLARMWELPDNLTYAIKFHHQPEMAMKYTDLAMVVYFADLLMSRFRVGLELERLNADLLTSRLDRIGLRVDQLPVLVDTIPQEFLV